MMYDQNSQNDNNGFENNNQSSSQYSSSSENSYTYVFSNGTSQGMPPHDVPPQKKPMNTERIAFAVLTLCLCVSLSFVAGFGGFVLAKRLNDVSQSGEPSINDAPDANDLHNENPDDILQQNNSEPSIYGSAGSEVFSISQVVQKVENAVVVVDVTVASSSFFGTAGTGSGSGVIISDQGYILTCHHVIENATTVTITLNSGNKYAASLVGSDPQSDLAVLKIDPKETLTYVEHGRSGNLVVGEYVVAIGNPLGTLGGTVTHGIVSATERSISMSDGTTMTLLQTDTAINSGNSGGGLFNLDGELIGIVNAKYESKEGLAFAIPIDSALPIEQDLIKYGYVRGIVDHGLNTLYISERELPSYKYYYGIDEVGVYVIESKYCTELANGDRIVSVNGTAITSADQLETLIKGYKVGDTLTIVASREGTQFTATLTLREYVPDRVANNLQ